MENDKQSLSVLSSAKMSLRSTATKVKVWICECQPKLGSCNWVSIFLFVLFQQQRFDLLTGQVDHEILPHYENIESLVEKISHVFSQWKRIEISGKCSERDLIAIKKFNIHQQVTLIHKLNILNKLCLADKSSCIFYQPIHLGPSWTISFFLIQ